MEATNANARRGGGLLAALTLSFLAFPIAADAHRSVEQDDGAVASGVKIAPLSHGEMIPVATHRGEIMDLAAAQAMTNPTFRRILNYERIQYAYCLWGMGPGGVVDEDSPYNECTHGYLAAAKALLGELRGMPGSSRDADALAETIERETRENPAQVSTCRFSAQSFDTARLVRPRLAEVAVHKPSVAIAGSLAMMLGGAALMTRRRRRIVTA